MRDLTADPTAAQMLLRVLNRELRPSQLFTTPKVARAAARVLRDRPDRPLATLKEIVSAARQNARRARQRRQATWPS
jgi:menaquinone-9 beta-reductase